MIPPSRAQFGEDSKDPPEPSAARRGLHRTPPEQRTLWEHQTPIERSRGPRKDARDPETILRIPRPQNLPSFLGDPMASQAYQTLISLLIYMGTGTVALCETDPV